MNTLYIDASAVSIALTSIVAAAVAVGATVVTLLRRAKKKLHLDENSKKEFEDELVINEEAEPEKSEDDK